MRRSQRFTRRVKRDWPDFKIVKALTVADVRLRALDWLKYSMGYRRFLNKKYWQVKLWRAN